MVFRSWNEWLQVCKNKYLRKFTGKYVSKDCKLPHYLPKDSFTTLVIGFVRLNGNKLVLPFSNTYRKTHKNIEITIPPVLLGKKVKEIRIIPKSKARFFEIQYIYEAGCIQRNLNKNNALALDFGVDNLVTAVSSSGRSFIVDGRNLNLLTSGTTRKTQDYRASKTGRAVKGRQQTARKFYRKRTDV